DAESDTVATSLCRIGWSGRTRDAADPAATVTRVHGGAGSRDAGDFNSGDSGLWSLAAQHSCMFRPNMPCTRDSCPNRCENKYANLETYGSVTAQGVSIVKGRSELNTVRNIILAW